MNKIQLHELLELCIRASEANKNVSASFDMSSYSGLTIIRFNYNGFTSIRERENYYLYSGDDDTTQEYQECRTHLLKLIKEGTNND